MANWALVVGINKYQKLRSLSYAVRDAELMRDFLAGEAQFDQVFYFTDDSKTITAPDDSEQSTQPTYTNLTSFLYDFFEYPSLGDGDNFWFFFSGHGIRHEGKDYLIPCDGRPDMVEKTCVSLVYVTERLRRCGADNVVLFLDACRNEGAKAGLGIGAEKHKGVITFSSCRPSEKSYEIEQIGQGAFTYALLEALRIQGESNCATVERLDRRLQWRVTEINLEYGKPEQVPQGTIESLSKYHLILLPDYIKPMEQDIIALREEALEAETEGDLKLAKQLWYRVFVLSPSNRRIRKAYDRVTIQLEKQAHSAFSPQPNPANESGRKSQTTSPEEPKLFSSSLFSSSGKMSDRQSKPDATPAEYANYAELSCNEREGLDYRIRYEARNSRTVIIAPHGGKIERGTSELAEAVAGNNHSFYALEGLKPKGNFSLHLTSTRFDEPRALNIVREAHQVVAMHGCQGEKEIVYLGGLDEELKERIEKALSAAGFRTGEQKRLLGLDRSNICNRGQTGKGVQLELTLALRKRLLAEGALSEAFVAAVRESLVESGLKLFQFEVVTVDARGREKSRRQGRAHYFVEELGDGVGLEMVAIPGGKFMMGSPEGEGFDSERPQHEVTIPPFFFGKYPVTQAQWQVVAGLPKVERDLEPDPSHFKGLDRPVEQVSLDDAVEFCNRLSKQTGQLYRLPSEAEWEYACRAGTKTPFYFGETMTGNLANYDACMIFAGELKGEYRKKTTPVGSFPPNAFGLYDLHGSVGEWCADPWHQNYKGVPRDGSVWDNDDYFYCVMRGGSWRYFPRYCRSAYRNYFKPDDRRNNFGFRIARSAPRTL